MVVSDLIKKLQAYCREHPLNQHREIFLRVDGETCYEFGEAKNGDGVGSNESYLIFTPDQRGRKFKMKEANLQG